MNKFGILLVILVLFFSSLACQTLLGGGNGANETETLPPIDSPGDSPAATPESSDDFNFSLGGEVDFPMPGDAFNVVNVAGVVNYQTNLSLDEVMAYYRDEFGKQGYTERDTLTVISDGVFSIVFDGHESGQAIVLQGVDLGDGSVNVNISLQDV